MADFDWHSLASMARHAREVSLPANRVLLQPPRRLRGVWYLAAGILRDETGTQLHAGSARARRPVYPGARELWSVTAVRLVHFGEQVVPMLQPDAATILPIAGGDVLTTSGAANSHWLDTLAASPLLRQLYARRGARGWQRWLCELETLDVTAAGPLISKGARGDFFYVVQRGTAEVEVPVDGSAQPALPSAVAQILPGGFFGEDALLSGQPRNATVRMPQGGRVLRGNSVQLRELVSDLWWCLARAEGSWRDDNELLRLRRAIATSSLRGWLGTLPLESRYGLSIDDSCPVQDLLLLLLVHRGYSVVLREDNVSCMQTL